MGKKKTTGARMGRPPKAPENRRSVLVCIRMTSAERKALDREAAAMGITLSDLLMLQWRQNIGDDRRYTGGGER